MLEANFHFSDNKKGINSYCVGKTNGNTPVFYQEQHVNRQHEVINNIVPDEVPLGLDDTQYATEEELIRTQPAAR